MEGEIRNYRCHECKDTGTVKEKSGTVHTCWTCLMEGRLDAHSKKLPDSNLRI
ncbi:MAG TPA: hypothetical protein VI815_03730 [Candidatus Nanoarchaeia archaeon]|nr:hypothetical protein [Candidatus Nanoarchaeia archaeon]